jgi:hypothetical protein
MQFISLFLTDSMVF